MYIEKLMMIISLPIIALAAAHWPGLCWQFQKGFPEPLETFPCSTNIYTVSLLPCVRCSWVVCECVLLLFLYLSVQSNVIYNHEYYSAGAVALRQFSPSSCIKRDLFISRNIIIMLYKTYLCNFNVAYRYKKIWTVHDMFVNWLYGGIRTLLFLWWTITVEPVLKGTCIERPPVYKEHIEILWISSLYPQSAYMACAVSKKDVISYSKSISDVKKKARPRKCKLLNDLKVWNHKNKRYTSKAVYNSSIQSKLSKYTIF